MERKKMIVDFCEAGVFQSAKVVDFAENSIDLNYR